MSKATEKLPIIIVGAGLIGLTLVHALKKADVPFLIFERDAHIDARATGWGISIYWALQSLESCLTPQVFKQIDAVQVDPEQGRSDTGRFIFLDLETGEPQYIIPPSFRRRVSRPKLRQLLARDIDVQWNKTFSSFRSEEDGGISVTFTDGTTVQGSLLVGADGNSSKIRRQLMSNHPDENERGISQPLPVQYLATTVVLDEKNVKPLREIDPLMFQGSHPETGKYLWCSMLSTPEANGSLGAVEEYYEVQLHLSWVDKDTACEEGEVPKGNVGRLKMMKSIAAEGTGFVKVLRETIENIPDDAEVAHARLADWPTVQWPSPAGRVTLVGDAAHAMTMYRGDAANHGFTDAAKLRDQIKSWHQGQKTREEATTEYAAELIPRGYEAALLSRQACLDAHDLKGLSPESPLVSKRARILVPGSKVEVGTARA